MSATTRIGEDARSSGNAAVNTNTDANATSDNHWDLASILPNTCMRSQMRLYNLLLLMLLLPCWIPATTHTVKLDGSGDYTVIQTAISSSTHGDSVLVYPGRYFENIDFLGKSITVSSLEATTSDSTYISSTIIDGNHNGSCVAFRNGEQNSTLRGFTLTNGTGYPFWDDTRKGGGVLIFQTGLINIVNCMVTNNHASMGAGLFGFENSLFLSGVKFYENNSVTGGGGIALTGSSTHYPSIVFDPVNRCSIYSNYGTNPVDILITDIRANLQINLDMFTVDNPDRFYVDRHSNLSLFNQYTDTVNIQRAYRTEVNHDLYVSPFGDDSNTGLSPAQAMRTITKAMHRIAADSLNIKSVFVMPGLYSEITNGQILPIPLKSYVNLIGAGSALVTVLADSTTNLGYGKCIGSYKATNILARGMKITESEPNNRVPINLAFTSNGLELRDIVVDGISAYYMGAFYAHKVYSSMFDSLVVRNVVAAESAFKIIQSFSTNISNSIFENFNSVYTSPDTPGDDSWSTPVFDIRVADSFTVQNSIFRNIAVQNNQPAFNISNNFNGSDNVVDVNINNCLFENIRTNGPKGLLLGNNSLGEYKVSNCTFYNNYGAGGAVGTLGKVDMRNNIFYDPDALNEVYMLNASPQSGIVGHLDFDYNNIHNGLSAIYNPDYRNTLIYGDNNNSAEPLFASTTPGDEDYLRLAANSPCIDTGTPDITGLDLPPYDLTWNWRVWNGRIDMGCYEYGSEPWVSIDDPVVPVLNGVMSVYPNPFRSYTNIRVELDSAMQNARLEVYNLRGQKVKSIALDASGKGQSWWDGRDDSGTLCANGVYVLSLSQGNKVIESKRVTLLK